MRLSMRAHLRRAVCFVMLVCFGFSAALVNVDGSTAYAKDYKQKHRDSAPVFGINQNGEFDAPLYVPGAYYNIYKDNGHGNYTEVPSQEYGVFFTPNDSRSGRDQVMYRFNQEKARVFAYHCALGDHLPPEGQNLCKNANPNGRQNVLDPEEKELTVYRFRFSGAEDSEKHRPFFTFTLPDMMDGYPERLTRRTGKLAGRPGNWSFGHTEKIQNWYATGQEWAQKNGLGSQPSLELLIQRSCTYRQLDIEKKQSKAQELPGMREAEKYYNDSKGLCAIDKRHYLKEVDSTGLNQALYARVVQSMAQGIAHDQDPENTAFKQYGQFFNRTHNYTRWYFTDFGDYKDVTEPQYDIELPAYNRAALICTNCKYGNSFVEYTAYVKLLDKDLDQLPVSYRDKTMAPAMAAFASNGTHGIFKHLYVRGGLDADGDGIPDISEMGYETEATIETEHPILEDSEMPQFTGDASDPNLDINRQASFDFNPDTSSLGTATDPGFAFYGVNGEMLMDDESNFEEQNGIFHFKPGVIGSIIYRYDIDALEKQLGSASPNQTRNLNDFLAKLNAHTPTFGTYRSHKGTDKAQFDRITHDNTYEVDQRGHWTDKVKKEQVRDARGNVIATEYLIDARKEYPDYPDYARTYGRYNVLQLVSSVPADNLGYADNFRKGGSNILMPTRNGTSNYAKCTEQNKKELLTDQHGTPLSFVGDCAAIAHNLAVPITLPHQKKYSPKSLLMLRPYEANSQLNINYDLKDPSPKNVIPVFVLGVSVDKEGPSLKDKKDIYAFRGDTHNSKLTVHDTKSPIRRVFISNDASGKVQLGKKKDHPTGQFAIDKKCPQHKPECKDKDRVPGALKPGADGKSATTDLTVEMPTDARWYSDGKEQGQLKKRVDFLLHDRPDHRYRPSGKLYNQSTDSITVYSRPQTDKGNPSDFTYPDIVFSQDTWNTDRQNFLNKYTGQAGKNLVASHFKYAAPQNYVANKLTNPIKIDKVEQVGAGLSNDAAKRKAAQRQSVKFNVTYVDGSTDTFNVNVVVKDPVADLTITKSATTENTIYSTDDTIKGFANPGAKIVVTDGAYTSDTANNVLNKNTVTADRKGHWEVKLKRPVVSAGATLKAPSDVQVVQINGNKKSEPVKVKVELGSVHILPFGSDRLEKGTVAAGQHRIKLLVPHDAAQVFFKMNEKYELSFYRFTSGWHNRGNQWKLINERQPKRSIFFDVEGTVSGSFHDVVTINIKNQEFAIKHDEDQSNTLLNTVGAVVHDRQAGTSGSKATTYFNNPANLLLLEEVGEYSSETDKWIYRYVSNDAPVLEAKHTADSPATYAATDQGINLKQELTNLVRMIDSHDGIFDTNKDFEKFQYADFDTPTVPTGSCGQVIRDPETKKLRCSGWYPKLEILGITSNGKAVQDHTLKQPGEYKVTVKAYDSQQKPSVKSLEIPVIITMDATAVTQNATHGTVYSTAETISGTGIKFASRIEIYDGDRLLGGTHKKQKKKRGRGFNWVPVTGSKLDQANDAWTVNLDEPVRSTHKYQQQYNVYQKPDLKVVKISVNDQGYETRVETAFTSELGSAHIMPFNSNQLGKGTVVAGQRELKLLVPHDSAFAYIDLNGSKYELGIKRKNLSAPWTFHQVKDENGVFLYKEEDDGRITHNDEKSKLIKVTGVTYDKAGDRGPATKFHDTVAITFTDPRFVIEDRDDDSAKDFVRLVPHLYRQHQSWSVYPQGRDQEYSKYDETISDNKWVQRAVSNAAPVLDVVKDQQQKPVDKVQLQPDEVLDNKALVTKGNYVTVTDVEDDVVHSRVQGEDQEEVVIYATVPQKDYPKVIVTKIEPAGGRATLFNESNQAAAKLDQPGDYTVTFKAFDSQKKESNEKSVRFVYVASLKVKTVDEVYSEFTKGSQMTLYKANEQGGFTEADDFKVQDSKVIKDKTKRHDPQPAQWDGLPAGTYFVKVQPQSKSRYHERLFKVEHSATSGGSEVTVPMQRASSEVGWEKIAARTGGASANTASGSADGAGQDVKYLGGSQWCVQSPQKPTFAELGIETEPSGECAGGVIVEDAEGDAANASAEAAGAAGTGVTGAHDQNALPKRVLKDMNPAKGKISVRLPWLSSDRNYTVTEHKAPLLYQKINTPYFVGVSSADDSAEFKSANSAAGRDVLVKTAANGASTQWFQIENERIPVVGVLMDSGARYALWAGFGFLMALAWFVFAWKRRMGASIRLMMRDQSRYE